MVLPQGKAVGEMLTSRDGLPYSAFRFLPLLLLILLIITNKYNSIVFSPMQVSPVCIASRRGFTLVKTSSGSNSWMGRDKKCKVGWYWENKDKDEEKCKNKDNSGIGERGQEPQGELVTFDKKL